MRVRSRDRLLIWSLAFATVGYPAMAALPDHPQPASGPFATPVTDALIDNSTSAEWMDGAEHPVADPAALHHAIWTRETPPTGGQLLFGKSNQPGARYLRIGFQQEIPVGSVLVRGGDQLSVLRAGAAYPGDLSKEAQWIPAQRVIGHQVGNTEVPLEEYALWLLPPGTKTRALRLSHTASATDQNFAGVLGGIYVLSSRFANLAPDAAVSTSANSPAAPLLVDLKNNNLWGTWDNGPTFPHPVTASTPEWITLVWRTPVQLQGLAALWAGFNAADTEIFTGPANVDPVSAPAAQWQSVGPQYTLHNQYPRLLGIDWLDFGKTVTTRAVRLRMTAVTDETRHPHLVGKTKNGTRVWLGELMALSPWNTGELKAAIAVGAALAGPHPPIPIHFTLSTPSYVTLVIDDAQGNRVRNLVSDTLFPAGANTAWWDGSDDLGRNPDAAVHGVYLIPTHFVAPGHYTVRGITHSAIDLRYEMAVYSAGSPPWETADGTGGWLTNHTPGSSALFVPADRAINGSKPMVYLGSYISEGGAALAWVDLDGHKQGGRGWIGGSWTGAPYLARDTGTGPDHSIYVASVFGDQAKPDQTGQPKQLRLTALTAHGDRAVLNYSFPSGPKRDPDSSRDQGNMDQIAGLSVRDGVLVASLAVRNELVLVDAAAGRMIGSLQIEDPRGSVFDRQGNLLVLSGKKLLRYTHPQTGISPQMSPQAFGAPEVVVAGGLEDPVGITLDDTSIYISDRGSSSQVKIFSMQGKLLRAIGHPGAPAAGPYDPLHMNNPRGMTIDSNQHLWVAEEDFQPKRVSEWTLDGRLVNAFYGPAEYGGGGNLDPADKSKFYYHGMEFKLDWATGNKNITSVLYRWRKGDLVLPRFGQPSDVLYSNGRRYFTNSYLGAATYGTAVGMLYLDEKGILHPVAAFGKANEWPVLLDPAFHAKLPPGSDLTRRDPANSVLFAWSDLNGNGQVDPDEVTFTKAVSGSITIDSGAQGPVMLDAYVDGKAMRYTPVRMVGDGIPVYDLSHGAVLADDVQLPPSDGGGQILSSAQATVLTTAPKPFAREGLGGLDAQGHRWSYPSLWPGLHPSHSAPVADRPGELLGTTRLLGGFVHAAPSGVGDLWGINGNHGDLYLFTADGLFVTQLFQDIRTGKSWNMPVAQRNMLLNDTSLHDENFFPSLAQSNDGVVYVVDGDRTSLVRVDGLNTLKRLPAIPLDLGNADLKAAQDFQMNSELARQQSAGPQALPVTMRSGNAPALHDLAATLASASWATVDRRITQVGWSAQPDLVEAAVTIAAGNLYAVWRSSDPNLLKNSGEMANAPFKTGGALDLMIGADPAADPARKAPVAGDLRLLIYQVNGQTHATLYRPVVKGTTNPVPFSSPDRTITIDQVQDVSNKVQLDAANGTYAISIPLNVLGFSPRTGQTIKADIGILRGNGQQTTQRVYWSNKATGITADVPSEAALTPNLWGTWVFQPAQ